MNYNIVSDKVQLCKINNSFNQQTINNTLKQKERIIIPYTESKHHN